MIDTLKALCALDGVSSWEDEVRDYIISRVGKYAESIKTDSMGNLIMFVRGKKAADKKIMLSAHMDEVGMLVNGITDDGYLKFAFVGGVDRRVVIGKRVRVGRNRIPGVIGIKAYHLVSAAEEKNVPKTDELYIDIGAEDKAAAEKLAALGDPVAFDSDVYEFGKNSLKAKAIDDRVGCAVMIKLIENGLPVDTWFAFTVQEEVGTRGAFASAFSVTPDIALVLEGTTAADIPSVEGAKRSCALGKGPVLSLIDGRTIYDRELFELLRSIAEENNIPWQTKQVIAGGTDAGAIQRTKSGVRVCGISAAVRYLHSPNSAADKTDIENCLKLAEKFLEKMGDECNV